jgi:hypothetical protein
MSIEAMKQALEALEKLWLLGDQTAAIANSAITSLRQAIAKAEKQEPVAWMSNESAYRLKHGGNSKGAVPVHAKKSAASKIPLYTHPPQREWVGLTDEEEYQICNAYYNRDSKLVEMIEAKLKEKNT